MDVFFGGKVELEMGAGWWNGGLADWMFFGWNSVQGEWIVGEIGVEEDMWMRGRVDG